jgi:RNA polymerase sigma factor (TIGR02999 family)
MSDAPADQTTAILHDLARGNKDAAHRLMPLVYDELRRLADNCFRHRAPGQTLQPTAVVHEAYIKLIDQTVADYRSRSHFIAVAATAMRQILIDGARRRTARKRGGGRQRVALDDAVAVTPGRPTDLLELDDAMRRLAGLDERKAKIVELRFFGGLSIKETAEALDLARSTVTEDWRMARAWLACELKHAYGDDGDVDGTDDADDA